MDRADTFIQQELLKNSKLVCIFTFGEICCDLEHISYKISHRPQSKLELLNKYSSRIWDLLSCMVHQKWLFNYYFTAADQVRDTLTIL